jgi:flavin-dependent thymidylate synthase
MKVTLLNYTLEALDLLLFTKQTRLAMNPGLMDEIREWPYERKMKELDYMLGTIHSSWEFVDYVFLIDGVSRAFTHQLVRSRSNSYAQQSQRTVDMSGFEYIVPRELRADPTHIVASTNIDSIRIMTPGAPSIYHTTMDEINGAYQAMIDEGVAPQDARGVLPTNVATNIVVKANLRSLSDMARLRLCTRTQGEYQDVFREIRARVIEVHPWAEPFLRVHCAATGVCAFPNYHECPIKGPLFNPDTGRRWDEATEPAGFWSDGNGKMTDEMVYLPSPPRTREEQQKAWENMDPFEAKPREASK